MILFELVDQNENNDVYRKLALSNHIRQLDFLQSVVLAALESGRPFLSQTVVKALNYHAMACLHPFAGEYRPCAVCVENHNPADHYRPPDHYRVASLMDDFINLVNRRWESETAIELSSFVLWRLNWIHPFINGNGRTARAACYFVLCVKGGGWLGGNKILPVLLQDHREEYVAALKSADSGNGLEALNSFIMKLLMEQKNS